MLFPTPRCIPFKMGKDAIASIAVTRTHAYDCYRLAKNSERSLLQFGSSHDGPSQGDMKGTVILRMVTVSHSLQDGEKKIVDTKIIRKYLAAGGDHAAASYYIPFLVVLSLRIRYVKEKSRKLQS